MRILQLITLLAAISVLSPVAPIPVRCPILSASSPQYDVSRWPQACIVTSWDRDGTRSHGSGGLVGTGQVVTAQHVLRDTTGRIQVTFPAVHKTVSATIKAWSPGHDLAVLALSSAVPIRPLALAAKVPAVGETVAIVAFDHAQQFRIRMARVRAYANFGHQVVQNRYLACLAGAEVVQGCSGGFVLSMDGRYCATISAAGEGETTVVLTQRVGPIRRLLGVRPSTAVIRQSCPTCPPTQAPATTAPQTSQPPPVTEPSQAQIEQLKAEIIADLKSDPALRGPEGPQGPQGPEGPEGPQGENGSLTLTTERLEQIVAGVASSLKNDPDFLDAVKGDPGSPAPPVNLGPIQDRIAALEAEKDKPLFYHMATLLITDENGEVVQTIELQPRTPVLKGGTLEYVGRTEQGAITDSFRVDMRD